MSLRFPEEFEVDSSYLPYPIETLKDRYLAPLGGFSRYLLPNQIGLNVAALRENTDLTPYTDAVLLARTAGKTTPVLLKKYFYVIPLKVDERPTDFCKSLYGEVVLPAVLMQKFLEAGELLILNSTVRRVNERTIKKLKEIFFQT